MRKVKIGNAIVDKQQQGNKVPIILVYSRNDKRIANSEDKFILVFVLLN